MKVLIDPEIFFYGRCGMVRYYSRLIKELEKTAVTIELPLLLSGSDFITGRLQKMQWLKEMPMGNFIINRLNSLSKRLYFKKVRRGNYDLLFINSPVFEDQFLNFLPPGKHFTMVVHDTMRCILGPDGLFDAAGNNADKLAYLSHRASEIICISYTTRDDLSDLTGLAADDMTVIHTGNLLETDEESKENIALPSQYLLFVGDRTGRKNFRFCITALADLLKTRKDLYIICTGKCNKWEQDILSKLDISEKVLFKDTNDHLLVTLYKNAQALLYPSVYEGYGLPVLEAMSLGCPVVTSHISAIPEVGQDAVFYIDPYNKNSLTEAVNQILNNPQNVKEMTDKAMKIAYGQTPEKMAALFKQTFASILAAPVKPR